jgi:hypothetical protein
MTRKKAPVYIWHWVFIIVGVSTALVVRSRLAQSDRIESVRGQSVQGAGDTRFIAVLYPKISRRAKPDSMSKSLFAEHMTGLKNAGYCPVGLQQICDLYDSKKLLPDKAVVILLDGHRDTCLNAAPVIEELGLRATVMLNIGAMRQTSRSFMSWHDLRKMRRDPSWDFGITTEDAGELREQLDYVKDHFQDLRICGVSAPTDMAGAVDFSPGKIVLFPPVEGDGYNSSSSDPSYLSLLRVAPQQDHRELVRMLSTISSQAPRVEDGFAEDAMRLNWISTCGDTRIVDGMMELSALPSVSNADAWSVGTCDWSDVDLAATFRVVRGRQFWAYARFRNEDNFVRLGCDGKRLFLQQKTTGAKLRNLKVVEFDCDFSQFHTLRLILRGPYAIAYLDGNRLSARPFRVDDSLVSGKVGLAAWDPSDGVACCRIARTIIRRLPCIALMNVDWHEGSSGWSAEHSDYLSYLCPNGRSVNDPNAQHEMDEHNALLISSAYGGHMLAPTITLDENDLESNDVVTLTGKLGDLVKNHMFEGVHLDCRKCRADKSSAELAGILDAFKTDSPGSTLIVSLSPQSYQSCEGLLEIPDVLVLQPEGRQCDFLNDVARPFRRKTLLRLETDEPSALVRGFVSPDNSRAAGDSKSDAGYIVQEYGLKGIALCKR